MPVRIRERAGVHGLHIRNFPPVRGASATALAINSSTRSRLSTASVTMHSGLSDGNAIGFIPTCANNLSVMKTAHTPSASAVGIVLSR